jgi:Mrp family chromosome partitioning ATPase
MAKLVQELKLRYPSRLVIFDLPPVLSVADALAFSPYVDCALMVVRERKTRREDMLRAAEMLNSIELIGTVLNMAAETATDAEPSRTGTHAGTNWLRRILGRKN